ncbi:MAG: 4-hydroxy-tetrahydrodipicolinate reductase [Bacteroidales bacterium]|nr:4-hydroxy-tetrahydrodipicolinate reductase [Bacteroidales bacterium]
MNIAISGYGRMGKIIESLANERNHKIVAIIDNESDWKLKRDALAVADVIIDFSLPQAVTGNIDKAFGLNIPIVIGTTGWDKERENIIAFCKNHSKTLFFSPNYSIGVNIFFELNKKLAELMQNITAYDVGIEEVHHAGKIDKPSGTARKLAEDLLPLMPGKEKWVNFASGNPDDLSIISFREGNITGNHRVIYTSEKDVITIEHKALNREGFALGAVLAAEWVIGKTGYFEMKDMLNFNK